ncbi:MAG: chemotaxis protein CheA [Candidatus Contendobacter sp.]|nr:chemotaxis protein CheA [Candidatus Contendobacter sp.]MDG4556734.1 chemotaxis protein CheA [Candidatus Contendobacter sp.]
MIELDPSLISDFVVEAGEHLEEMESMLLRLAEDPANRDLFNAIFRPVHTIKGASQFMGLVRIAALSHKLEDLLDLLRQGKRPSSPGIVETLIVARDHLAMLVADLARSQTEETPVDHLIARLERIIEGREEVEDVEEPVEPVEPVESATLGVETPKPPSTVPPAPEMGTYEEEYDKELFAIFIEQLREKLAFLSAQAQRFATAPDQFEVLEQCLDSIRSLDSSANYMGYQALSLLYEQWCDAILAAQQAVALSQPVSMGFMETYVERVIQFFPQHGDRLPEGGEPPVARPVARTPAPEIAQDLLPKESLEDQAPPAPLGKPPVSAVEPAPAQPGPAVVERPEEPAAGPAWETEGERQKAEPSQEAGERVLKKSVRVDAHKIDILMNQVGELIVDRSYFFQLFNEMRNLQQYLKVNAGLDPKDMKLIRAFTYRFGEAIVSLSRTSNELQEGVMKVRMLPIAQLFNRYPRLIHDLTRGTNKQVQLEIRGEETELDRMIIEEISDPLIHLIRNAVDHGFETVAERKRLDKPPTGTLLLEAYHESNHIVIEMTDDGRGMNPELIKSKALEKGLFSREELERMSARELLRLIMTPGFSTAAEVTNTSGRGVGMDVVKKNIEKLNGTIDIESTIGLQTRIRLKIPLTLAIISALMVRVGDNLFTVPLANVEETLRIFAKDITTVEGTEVIHLRGRTTPIFRLSVLFDIPSNQREAGKFFVVIVNAGLRKLGLVVDELLGQEEVVIKPLVDYLQEKSGLSGATIIGDGRVSLILDVYELANIAMTRQVARYQELSLGRRKAAGEKTSYPATGRPN